jgi:GAF domain-containing protein
MATSFHRSYRMSSGDQQGLVRIQLAAWREQMLSRLLPWTTLVATGAIALGALSVAARRNWFFLPLYIIVYLVLVALTLVRRIGYHAKARILLLLIAALGISVLAETGLGGVGRAFLLVLPIAAVVLLDWRFSLAGLGLGTGALLVYGFSQNQILDSVLSATINAMLATGVIISVHTIIENLTAAVAEELKAGEREKSITDHLERKTGELKSEVQRRSGLLALVVEFGELVSMAADPPDLLDRAVVLLVERCNLVGATIYLLEDGGRTAVLHAAAGEAAGRLLEESRVVKVGERSLLGWCLESDEPQIRHDSDYLFHPTIPESRSALVLPIRARGHVVGAIELHATCPEAFGDQMVSTLGSVAGLVGLALDTLREADFGQSFVGEMGAPGRAGNGFPWPGVDQRDTSIFAEYHVSDLPAWSSDEIAELVEQDLVIALPLGANGDRRGHLLIEAPKDSSSGDIDVEFLQSVADQVGTALESAQIFEDTRRRAVYGQMMTEMSARVRSSLDPDTILKTAVRELGRALGAKLTTVEVNTPGSDSPASRLSPSVGPRKSE